MLTLNWTPDAKARHSLGNLIEKDDSDHFNASWEQRQEYCAELEKATADAYVLEELVKVGDKKTKSTHILIFYGNCGIILSIINLLN